MAVFALISAHLAETNFSTKHTCEAVDLSLMEYPGYLSTHAFGFTWEVMDLQPTVWWAAPTAALMSSW